VREREHTFYCWTGRSFIVRVATDNVTRPSVRQSVRSVPCSVGRRAAASSRDRARCRRRRFIAMRPARRLSRPAARTGVVGPAAPCSTQAQTESIDPTPAALQSAPVNPVVRPWRVLTPLPRLHWPTDRPTDWTRTDWTSASRRPAPRRCGNSQIRYACGQTKAKLIKKTLNRTQNLEIMT